MGQESTEQEDAGREHQGSLTDEKDEVQSAADTDYPSAQEPSAERSGRYKKSVPALFQNSSNPLSVVQKSHPIRGCSHVGSFGYLLVFEFFIYKYSIR